MGWISVALEISYHRMETQRAMDKHNVFMFMIIKAHPKKYIDIIWLSISNKRSDFDVFCTIEKKRSRAFHPWSRCTIWVKWCKIALNLKEYIKHNIKISINILITTQETAQVNQQDDDSYNYLCIESKQEKNKYGKFFI